MGNILTSILTDASLRDMASVDSLLASAAEIAEPWLTEAASV